MMWLFWMYLVEKNQKHCLKYHQNAKNKKGMFLSQPTFRDSKFAAENFTEDDIVNVSLTRGKSAQEWVKVKENQHLCGKMETGIRILEEKVENIAEKSEIDGSVVRKPMITGNRRLKKQNMPTKIIWEHSVDEKRSSQKSGGAGGPLKSNGCKRKRSGREAKINKRSRPLNQTLHFYWGPRGTGKDDCSSRRTAKDDSRE